MMMNFPRGWFKNVLVAGLCYTAINALCLPVAYAGIAIKNVTVDSQFMRFPKIPLDGIQYAALSFDYGTSGTASVTAVHEKSELAKCGMAHYLKVEYQGPEVVFRILDGSRNKILLRKNIDTAGSYDFGKDGCRSVDEVKADFEAQKTDWQIQLNKQLLADARKQMNAFIQEDTALEYESIRFPLFFISSDSSRFNVLNEGFDQARKAFDLYQQFGATIDAQATLNDVVAQWEQQLEDLDYRRNTNPADQDVIRVLHRNLSISYFFISRFDQARKHDALAISKGMPKEETLQPLILKHERRYIFSPNVAKNMVLMANLYRFGSNVVKGAVLQEVSMDSLKAK